MRTVGDALRPSARFLPTDYPYALLKRDRGKESEKGSAAVWGGTFHRLIVASTDLKDCVILPTL